MRTRGKIENGWCELRERQRQTTAVAETAQSAAAGESGGREGGTATSGRTVKPLSQPWCATLPRCSTRVYRHCQRVSSLISHNVTRCDRARAAPPRPQAASRLREIEELYCGCVRWCILDKMLSSVASLLAPSVSRRLELHDRW